jgi:regulator of sigma E protease
MHFLTTVLYFVITLGVLVLVHELGHFLAAKIFRMRVERFSIGFPPRAFGRKMGETDYCISWIPIGGYVKISGMIDESFDTDFLNRSPEPWEFRAKPLWQRMIVICAGVVMNIILAVGIFWAINYVQGSIIRETTTIGYVAEKSPAATIGFKAGDRVLKVNGQSTTDWDQIGNDVYIESMGKDITFIVQRGDSTCQLFLPRTSLPEPDKVPLGIIPEKTELMVTSVDPDKPAFKLGLKPHDILLSFNGIPVRYQQNKVGEIVHANAGRALDVDWRRGNEEMHGTTIPTKDGLIGISFSMQYNGPERHIHYSLLEALPRGIADIGNVTVLFVQQIWQIVTGRTPFSESVGGPIRIAQMATQSAAMGLLTYLGFMALLSVSLAVLNILPFPALDGGHLIFLVYEGLFHREVPVKIRLGLQHAGFILLLAFMAIVVYNDIVHF